MFNQNQKRIGFCCKVVGENSELYNGKTTTHQWLSRQSREQAHQRLWDLMVNNTQSFERLIKYVGTLESGRKMVRLGSDCLPFYTHPAWRQYWQQSDVQSFLERAFAKVGETARGLDVRISFHPGQFVCLASHRPDVVERSIEEFEYHVDMARWMGRGRAFQDFKINVHISGRKGPQGIKDVLGRLTPEARNCITIENDEMCWGLDATLELRNHLALVLDIHHHFIATGEYIQPTDDRFKRVIDSWRGVRPVIHYSYSRDEHLPKDFEHNTFPNMKQLLEQGHRKQKLRAHSECYPNAPVNDWALSFLETADIMAECKSKNIGAGQLYHQAIKNGYLTSPAMLVEQPTETETVD